MYSGTIYLTVGKKYEVLDKNDRTNLIKVADDTNVPGSYRASRFTIDEEIIPVAPQFALCINDKENKLSPVTVQLTAGKKYEIIKFIGGETGMIVIVDDSNRQSSYLASRFTIDEEIIPAIIQPEQGWLVDKNKEIIKVVSDYFQARNFRNEISQPMVGQSVVCHYLTSYLTIDKEYTVLGVGKNNSYLWEIVNDLGRRTFYNSAYFRRKKEGQ